VNARSAAAKKAPEPNPYEWHDNAMKGVFGPKYETEPQTGWYRNRKLISAKGETPKRYEFQSVAFWKDTRTGEQRCHINGKAASEDQALRAWLFCSQYPISEETYHAFLETGQWPEHNAAIAEQERRSNEAPDDDSLEGVRARIDALIAEANRLMKAGPAKTKAEADAAADVAVRLGELYTHADNLRKAEKKPHWDKAQAVDAEWNPVRDSALVYKQLKSKVVQPFLDAENARLKAEAEAAEAARLKVIAEARAKAEEEEAARAAEYAEQAEKAIQEQKPLPPAPAPVEVKIPDSAYVPTPTYTPVRAGTGKTVSTRIERTMLIEDYAKALAFFAEHDEIKAKVQELANKLAKAKMTVPGCKILENGKAV
jgi:hypothetical protein